MHRRWAALAAVSALAVAVVGLGQHEPHDIAPTSLGGKIIRTGVTRGAAH